MTQKITAKILRHIEVAQLYKEVVQLYKEVAQINRGTIKQVIHIVYIDT